MGVDGEGHINIYAKGVTDLGRALTFESNYKLDHDVHGPFRTLEGFWHFIRSVERDERLRRSNGILSRKIGRTLTTRHVPDFHWIIADAAYQRVKQSDKLSQMLVESTLPFDMYYLTKTTIGLITGIRASMGLQMIPVYEHIRKSLKENREPDFSWLGNDPNKDLKRIAIGEEMKEA